MAPHQPSSKSAYSATDRKTQIDKICAGFVAPGKANRDIYRIILERVLPAGSGIPGPLVTEAELRKAVNAIKPGYQDVFRRVRELQGEEGLEGLVKVGTQYQLQHLAIGQKREPRKHIKQSVARKIALAQGNRCTVCGSPIASNGDRIDVDHRVPRLRGGTSYEGNLQVLCKSCNNAKSTQCSNCELNCNTCGWAVPEQYRPVKLRPDVTLRLNELAKGLNQDVGVVTNAMLDKALQEAKK